MPPVGTTGRPRIVFGRGVELRADGHWGCAGHSGWLGDWEAPLAAAGRPPFAGAWAGGAAGVASGSGATDSQTGCWTTSCGGCAAATGSGSGSRPHGARRRLGLRLRLERDGSGSSAQLRFERDGSGSSGRVQVRVRAAPRRRSVPARRPAPRPRPGRPSRYRGPRGARRGRSRRTHRSTTHPASRASAGQAVGAATSGASWVPFTGTSTPAPLRRRSGNGAGMTSRATSGAQVRQRPSASFQQFAHVYWRHDHAEVEGLVERVELAARSARGPSRSARRPSPRPSTCRRTGRSS